MRVVWRLAPAGRFISRRGLRRALLAAIGASCLGLVLLAARVSRVETPPPPVSLAPAAMQGFRSTSYTGGRLRLRITGDSLTVSHPKLFGPVSLGFLRAVTVRNVTVETFAADGTVEPALSSSLEAIPALLAQQGVHQEIAEAELAPIKVIEHRDGESKVLLSAASCSAGMWSRALVCKDGVIGRDGNAVRFRELTYDGETKALRTTP